MAVAVGGVEQRASGRDARRASTALSRGRVEREEIELFLRERYAEPVAVVAPATLGHGAVRAAR